MTRWLPFKRWRSEQTGSSRWLDEPQWKDGGKVLVTAVEVPTDVQEPAQNGETRVEVELHGPLPQERLEDALDEVRVLLNQLPDLKEEALRLAPEEWRHHYLEGGPGASEYEGLWLSWFEFYADGRVCLNFNYGPLDHLMLELHPGGDQRVTIEP